MPDELLETHPRELLAARAASSNVPKDVAGSSMPRLAPVFVGGFGDGFLVEGGG